MQTEGTCVAREAQAYEMDRDGIDEYSITTMEDGHVCPGCIGAARQTYRLEDRQPGQNFPPLHPRCRCVVNPEVTDWDEWLAKQGETNYWSVDYRAVNSKEFHDKFSVLPFPKPVRESLYRVAVRMLAGMYGTMGERLAAIDARTGAIVADTFARRPDDSQAYFNDEGQAAIAANPNRVVFLHNHPGGSDPSYDDIRSALSNPYMEGSVIAGHNGRVYLILPDKSEEAYARLLEWLEMLKELTSDRKQAEDMARQAFLEENARRRWLQCVEIRAGTK